MIFQKLIKENSILKLKFTSTKLQNINTKKSSRCFSLFRNEKDNEFSKLFENLSNTEIQACCLYVLADRKISKMFQEVDKIKIQIYYQNLTNLSL